MSKSFKDSVAYRSALKLVFSSAPVLGALSVASGQSLTAISPPGGASGFSFLGSNPNGGMARNGQAILGSGTGYWYTWLAPTNTYGSYSTNPPFSEGNYYNYDVQYLQNISDDSSTVVGYDSEYWEDDVYGIIGYSEEREGSWPDYYYVDFPVFGFRYYDYSEDPAFIGTPQGTIENTFSGYNVLSANLVSNGGTTVFGETTGDQAYSWTSTGGMVLLPNPSSGPMNTICAASDGSVVFGTVNANTAYMWSSGTGSVALGSWVPAAGGCSSDGQTAVGISQSNNQATIYRVPTTTTTNGPENCTNIGISPDGLTAYGTYSNTSDGTSHGFLINVLSNTLTDLGENSSITGGSDGRFLGYGSDGHGAHTGFYQLGYGWVDTSKIFAAYGLGAGWTFNQQPSGISADGTIMYGRGLLGTNSTYWYSVLPNVATAVSDTYVVNSGSLTVSAPGVLANDVNVYDSSPSVVAQPTNGTVALNSDGSFTYTPNSGFEGNDSFTYQDVTGSQDPDIASGLTSNVATVNIIVSNATLSSVTASPSSVVGGTRIPCTVNLSAPAPSGGLPVTLSSNSADVQVPSTVVVPAGFKGAAFYATTSQVANPENVVITGTFGSSTQQTGVTLEPQNILSLVFSSDSVLGGSRVSANLNLAGHTSSTGSGDVVTLSSSSPDVQVPSTETVPAGYQGVAFSFTTSGVSAPEIVTITATLGTSTIQSTLTLNPPSIASFGATPSTVVGGSSTTFDLNLSGHAGTNGVTVTMQSSDPSVEVPATITVPSGYEGASFKVRTTAVMATKQVTITATVGSSQMQTIVTVNP